MPTLGGWERHPWPSGFTHPWPGIRQLQIRSDKRHRRERLALRDYYDWDDWPQMIEYVQDRIAA